VEYGKQHGKNIDEQVDATLDNLLVQFGSEILKIVPGRVSTEVDARFSFDTQKSVEKALHIIEVCEPNRGLSRALTKYPHSSTKRGVSRRIVS